MGWPSSTSAIRPNQSSSATAIWDPPFGGGTHSPLPLPDRNLLVVADEANFANCSLGLRYIWMFDVRVPSNPVSIATMPVPDEVDYCKKGGHFGPHNLWENRPGAFQSSRFIFATLHNAGVRAYDIANPFQPREVGYFVPPPSRAHVRSAAEPAAGDPVVRLLRRRGGRDVRHQFQRRPVHPAIRGRVIAAA